MPRLKWQTSYLAPENLENLQMWFLKLAETVLGDINLQDKQLSWGSQNAVVYLCYLAIILITWLHLHI